MHRMYDMIRKQPEELQYAVENCSKHLSEVSELLKNKHVYLTGCGSSFHAAIYGEYALRVSNLNASAVHAMDILHYTPKLDDSAVIVISHSWKTVTTLQALEVLRKHGTSCIGITANKDGGNVEVLLRSSSGFDESDCVTMGYTTTLAALASISGVEDVREIPPLASQALRAEAQVRELVATCSEMKRFFFLGAGPDTATAYEAALKMKEGNFTDAEGMQLEQMLHGSISGVDSEDAVFLVATQGSRVYPRFLDAAAALKDIGALTIAITDSDVLANNCKHAIKMSPCSELAGPMISIIPLQLFAYHLAVAKGVDPDLTREDDTRYRNAYSKLGLHRR